MPRPKKPASVTTGHTQSKSELEERIKEEQKMKGANDLVSTPPSTIDMDNYAVVFYGIVVNMLDDSDLLSNLDRFSVGILADDLAKMRYCNEKLQSEGYVVMQTTKSGEKEVVNPIYQIYKDAKNDFTKLATQFGLTPSSRASLSDIALQQRKDSEDPFTTALAKLNEESLSLATK